MPNNIDIYQPRYMAEVVRQNPPTRTFFKDTFFTNRKTFCTQRVDIDIKKGTRKMAAFVHPRVGGVVLHDSGFETQSYAPPLVNPYTVTTADQLMQRLPGEDIYSGVTPAQRGAKKLTEEYNALNDSITRREEWMCVQALMEGEIPVVGPGVNEVINFGHTNREKLTGTKQWGKADGKILENLEDWEEKIRLNGFVNPDGVIMGKSALRAFMADETVMKLLDNRRVEMGLIHPKDLPNGVKYIGHLNNPNLDIYTYSEVYLDDWTNPGSPEVKPLFADNKILMASWSAGYMLAYGACTYVDENGSWVTSETDRLLRSYVAHRPDRREIEAQSRPLPIPDKADSWFVAEVC